MIEVSNAERVVYPKEGYTKGDVVAYYGRAAERMLPHVVGRPMTIKRYPKGTAGPGFFQKNAGSHFPDYIGRITLPKSDGVTVFPSVSTADGLMYLANQGAISFHMPMSREPTLYSPDRLVLDLDPPANALAKVKRGAMLAKELFDALGVVSTPVMTGSKGYHIVVSLTPTLGFDEVHEAARKLAALLVKRHPDVFTEAFRKEKRGSLVYVDWLRNAFAATAVTPWSLRGKAGAPVAVPITWDELPDSKPNQFNLSNIAERLAMDDPVMALPATDPQAIAQQAATLADQAGIVLEPFDPFRS